MDTTTRCPAFMYPFTLFKSLFKVLADWGQTFRQWPQRIHLSGIICACSSFTWMAFTSQ